VFLGHVFGTVGKLLVKRGTWAWFCGIPTNGVEVMDF